MDFKDFKTNIGIYVSNAILFTLGTTISLGILKGVYQEIVGCDYPNLKNPTKEFIGKEFEGVLLDDGEKIHRYSGAKQWYFGGDGVVGKPGKIFEVEIDKKNLEKAVGEIYNPSTIPNKDTLYIAIDNTKFDSITGLTRNSVVNKSALAKGDTINFILGKYWVDYESDKTFAPKMKKYKEALKAYRNKNRFRMPKLPKYDSKAHEVNRVNDYRKRH
ncbi:hypothetical protein K9L67_03290 [Candidatus Woesearchaeota archaeon]|nr:hypothetical protein [Candidatus Woesearchaeota archaeon]MCF7901226.1 hypothetical protein [Candidatus Woesearchaeota archaeon]MCF8013755.1 hypothetical protein [Candidatus Woesearchaeota archaeon]